MISLDQRSFRLIFAICFSLAVHVAFMCWGMACYGWVVNERVRQGEGKKALSVTFSPYQSSVESVERPEVLSVDQGEAAPLNGKLERQNLPQMAAAPMPEDKQPSSEIRSAQLPQSEVFLPKESLTQSAVPLSDIHIPWPSAGGAIGVQRARFTLFIDETGRVVKMVPDGHSLQPAMEQAAEEAFHAARFLPAQKGGWPVKSMLRIEVSFEAIPAEVVPKAQIQGQRVLQ